MLAALLGALSLFAAAPAQAQTNVWSATLTTRDLGSGQWGCYDSSSVVASRCSSTSTLTDNDFEYDGVVYQSTGLFRAKGTQTLAQVVFDKVLPQGLIDRGTLHLDSTKLSLSSASADVLNGGTRLQFGNSGLSAGWNPSRTVSLQLTVAVPPSTVTLSAFPNPVREGKDVTVTATLSRALSSSVSVPVTLTRNTSESGDHGTLPSITIDAGATTGTGTISTVSDADEDDETFTVSLGTLPSSVTAGTPSSVTITIAEYVLTVEADPLCDTKVADSSVVVPFPRIRLVLDPPVSKEVKYEAISANGDTLPSPLSSSVDNSSFTDTNEFHAYTSLTSVVQLYRRTYPTRFAGFKFRLADVSSVTARCIWMFDSGGGGGPPPSNTDTGSGSGGGGGLPPSGSSDEPPPEDEESSDPDQPDACGENDRENLERFYETTGGAEWDENENWNSDEAPQEWFGVETDEDGNVVSLRLSENNLSGNMPEELLLCLSELKELALWGNDDLSGEVPEKLVLAVERAVLRDIAETLDLNPEWFENYEDPYNFEDWYEGATTDEEGRVAELDLPGEVPGTLISQLRKLRVITTSSENGGCALSPEDDSSAFGLFLLALLVFAALGRKRARG